MSLSIEHYTMVDYCPAFILIQEGNAYLATKKYVLGMTTYWDDKVIALKLDDDIIGVMTYRKIEHLQSLWISLAYIAPQHRGAGYYKKLWEAITAKAKEEGMKYVSSGAHVKNVEAQRAFASVGRQITSYDYRTEVE